MSAWDEWRRKQKEEKDRQRMNQRESAQMLQGFRGSGLSATDKQRMEQKAEERRKKQEAQNLLQSYQDTKGTEEAIKAKKQKEEERKKTLEAQQLLQSFQSSSILSEDASRLKAMKEKERQQVEEAERMLRKFQNNQVPDGLRNKSVINRPDRSDLPPIHVAERTDDREHISQGAVKKYRESFNSPSRPPPSPSQFLASNSPKVNTPKSMPPLPPSAQANLGVPVLNGPDRTDFPTNIGARVQPPSVDTTNVGADEKKLVDGAEALEDGETQDKSLPAGTEATPSTPDKPVSTPTSAALAPAETSEPVEITSTEQPTTEAPAPAEEAPASSEAPLTEVTAPADTSAPVEAPAERAETPAPAETPVETTAPVETPVETSAPDERAETPAPAEAPLETPAPAETPAEAPAPAEASTPAEVPSAPTQAPAPAPAPQPEPKDEPATMNGQPQAPSTGPSARPVVQQPSQIRLDVLFSFGLLTSASQPYLDNYMMAVEEVVLKTLAGNKELSGFVRYDKAYGPFVQEYNKDSKYRDPAGRKHVHRVLVIAAIPVFLSNGITIKAAREGVCSGLQQSMKTGEFIRIAKRESAGLPSP